jgi:N-dimethylarginine dimethylaminohydrolase
MKTFLMCEPRYFEVSYVINPWMAGNQGRVDKKLAARQWENLYNAIAQRATIKLIEPIQGLPDMVFTANGGLVAPGHEVVLASFRHKERQPEAKYFGKFFEQNGYCVKRLGDGMIFEGAGDALYGSSGKLWFGEGPRSGIDAVHQVAKTLHTQANVLSLVDPKWYHLDTAFCPLAGGHAMAYAHAFTPESVDRINREFKDKVVWVSDEDAGQFACNALNIGSDIICYKASDKLKATLAKLQFNVIEVDVSEFVKAGGACKCLTLEI